jgi:hypothetical protein
VGIVQSGSVTPGHFVVWTTDGTVQDGGPFFGTSETVLAQLISANMNTTNDQQIAIPNNISKFQLTRIIVTNANISLTTAVGGFYTTVSKGGTSIVANTQVYSALTDSTKLINPTLTSYGGGTAFTPNILTVNSIYLSLTTAQGAPCTADIYLCGIVLATI